MARVSASLSLMKVEEKARVCLYVMEEDKEEAASVSPCMYLSI